MNKKTNPMTPIKYTKIKENIYNFDNMTLINIVSHEGNILYFFVVEYVHKFRGNFILEKELIEVSEDDYSNIINSTYKII